LVRWSWFAVAGKRIERGRLDTWRRWRRKKRHTENTDHHCALNTPARRRQIANIGPQFELPAPEVMIAGIFEMWSILIASALAAMLVLLGLRWGLQRWIDSVYKH
jgi:hypothetical protein